MKEKERMLDKKISDLKSKKIIKKRSLQERGITLIALVVTIIILLILAGVTLNIALSDNGLFSKTKEAAEKYKKAQKDEEEMVRQIATQMYSEYVGAYVTGYEPTNGTCKISKEISGIKIEDINDSSNGKIEKDEEGNQIFTTSKEKEDNNELKWRIWDFDGTTLRIILDQPTKQKLTLKGAIGYNNGVWAVNEICRQCFGQFDINDEIKTMKKGISVANLKRSDIEKVSNYDYTKYKHEPNSSTEVIDDNESMDLIHYGEKKPYKECNSIPVKWIDYDSKWNYEYVKQTKTGIGDPSSEEKWEQEFENVTELDSKSITEGIEAKQSCYAHNYKENEFNDTRYYNLIFAGYSVSQKDNTTWLAGRSVCLYDYCTFGLDCIADRSDACRLTSQILSRSSAKDALCASFTLRPIVSINLNTSGYNIVRNDENGSYELTIEN